MCLPLLAPLGFALGATTATSAAALGTVTAASLAIGGASAGIGIAGQASAAKAQNQYRQQLGISQNERYAQTVASVQGDIQLQIGQLAQRKIEQNAAQQQELSNIAREAKAASSTTRTMQAAAGIEGVSVELLHQQFEQNLAAHQMTAKRNMDNFTRQTDMEARAIYARGQSIINSGYPQPLPPPATVNVGTSIMNGITTGLSVFGALQSFRTPDGVGSGLGGSVKSSSSQSGLFPSKPPNFLEGVNSNNWMKGLTF